MAIVEEAFPRGGKVKENKSATVPKNKKITKPENLFKVADKKKAKKRPLKKKTVKASEEKSLTAREKKNIEKEKTALESIEPLAYKVLAEGMHVLGKIQEIREMDVILSLPGRIQAVVPITNISTPYSKLLDRLAQDEDIEVAAMSTFLSVGDIFPCTIKEVTNDGSFKVTASLNPADLCNDIPLTALSKGMKMVAAVQSVEDHGYVMDVGMASARSFLKKDSNLNLSEGAILNVCIVNCQIDGHVATLTLSTEETVKFKQNVDINLVTILPGTKLQANVKKVTPQGVIVSIGNLLGYVHKDHLASTSTQLSSYEENAKTLTVVALYTLPVVNAIYLSLKTSLIDPKKGAEKHPLNIGRILDSTIIETTNAGLFVQLNKTWKGFVPLRHLSDSQDIIDDVKGHFPVKSRKRCRIVGLSSLDEIYICTMKKSLVEQKHLRYEDFQVGEMVEGKIESVSPAGVAVQLGIGLKGFIPKLHWADDPRLKRPELRFKIGETVKGRVLKVNLARKNVHLTCKKTLLESTEPVYSQPSELTRGLQLKGTVTLIEKGGVLVTFFGDLTGYMPRDFVKLRGVSDIARYFYVGQLIDCVITNITEEGKMTVNLPGEAAKKSESEPQKAEKTKKAKQAKETPAGCKPAGAIVTCKVTKIFDAEEEASKGLEVFVPGVKSKCFVPVEHLTDFAPLASHLFKCYQVGDAIEEAAIWSSSELQTILTLKPSILQFINENRFPKTFEEIQVNASYPVVSTKHRDFGVFAALLSPPGHLEPLFPVSKLPPLVYKQLKTARDVSLEGKVISIDAEKKRITFSGLDEDLEETSAELLNAYMQDLDKIRNHYSAGSDEKLKALASLKIGDPVIGKLDAEFNATSDLMFQLQSGLKAVVPGYHHASKNFKKGDLIAGAVLHCDLIEQVVYVTVRDEVISHISRLSPTSVAGTHVKATILFKTELFSLVSTNKENVRNYAYVSNIRNVNAACTKISPPFKVGDTTFVDVVESVSGRIATYHKKPKKWEAKKRPAQPEDEPESKKMKSAVENEAMESETVQDQSIDKKQKKKKENSNQKTVNEGNEATSAVGDTKKAKKQAKKEKAVASVTAEKSDDPEKNNVEAEASPAKKRRVDTTANALRNPDALTLPRLAVGAFKWDDDYATLPLAAAAADSSDSEDEVQDKKEKKTTVKDRRERAKQKLEEAKKEEARLSKIEEELNDPNRAPTSADDFDRMVLSSPNSSILWLQYMAHHLENAEIEKARAVARRALKTITFREEQEKFNVWIGLLNLEHMYGTTEGYDETFQEALRYNEPFKVYRQMALNFEQSGKSDEAESLHKTMMKKFKQDKSVWLNACIFYVRNSKLDTARSVFQKALTVLDKRDHIDLISRFAQLEVKFGQIERGKTLFDTMMMSYPKRTDLWIVYTDTLTKAGDVEGARQVLERCVTLQLPAKKMKSIFQKFLDFETHHGSEERKDYVRQKALEYVEAKSNSAEGAD